MWANYQRMLIRRPYATKSITAAALMASGELIQQTYKKQTKVQQRGTQIRAFWLDTPTATRDAS